jgi:hypothetical protein
VAELYSGIHFISLRSYLKPLAFLRASLVEFMTRSASLQRSARRRSAQAHQVASNALEHPLVRPWRAMSCF